MGETGGDGGTLGRFVAASRCVFCGSSQGSLAAIAIEDLGDREIVHVGCLVCGNAVLAVVTVSEGGLFSVGLRTDCTSRDALRFRGFRPLAPDDAISIHEVMGSGQGFIEALRQDG